MSSRKDLTGQRFGKLIILYPTDRRMDSGSIVWKCKCDCGNLIEVGRDKLLSGGTTSCGCGRKPPRKDYLGKRFGMLTVTGHAGKKGGVHYWRCQCHCGNQTEVSQSNLQSGQISCGCIQNQRPGLNFVDGTFVEGIQSNTLSKANTSGIRGVYFNKKRGKWIAQIMFKGRCYYLGGYSQMEDAVKARKKGQSQSIRENPGSQTRGDSIGVQFKQSADYARNQMTLSEDYGFLRYEDKGLSGYYSDRPDFQRLLRDIEMGKIRAAACYKLDRISRKTSDLMWLLEYFERHDVTLLVCSNNINTQISTYKIIIQVLAIIAELRYIDGAYSGQLDGAGKGWPLARRRNAYRIFL